MNEDEMIRRMSEEGLRITEQRKTLVELFQNRDGYQTPKAVYEYMQKKYPGLSFDTVYRNLRLMHEIGILEQFVFEDGLKFRRNCGDGHHHHHLICTECEKTISIDFCPMDWFDHLPDSFKVVRHKFELYGLCGNCQKESVPRT